MPLPRQLLRLGQTRPGDEQNDQLTPGQIATNSDTSVTQDDFQNGVLSQIKQIIFGTTTSRRWFEDFQSENIPSLFEQEIVDVVPFAYNTPSPMVIRAVSTGQLMSRALILLSVPFDGVGSFIELGTTAAPDLVLGSSDVTVLVSQQYANDELVDFTNDHLILTISPAASTRGAGLLYYRLTR